jgi:CHAT domain-containing protein/tetratricopeptide (TPR) repeat protein
MFRVTWNGFPVHKKWLQRMLSRTRCCGKQRHQKLRFNPTFSSLCLGLMTFGLIITGFPAFISHFSLASEEPPLTQPFLTQDTPPQDLLAQGKQHYEAGRFFEATQYWQQAATRYQAQENTLERALSLSFLSLAYQSLGQWEPAKTTLSESLKLLTTQSDLSRQGLSILAQTLNTQGSLQLALGQIEAALATWQKSEQTYRTLDDQTGIVGSQINQAQALQNLGFYRRAQSILEQIAQQIKTQPDNQLKATFLRSLGVTLQGLGNFKASQAALEQSLELSRRLNLPVDVSATLFQLGNTARAIGDTQPAITYYQQAAQSATIPLDRLLPQLNLLNLLIKLEQWDQVSPLIPVIQSNLTQLPMSRFTVYAQVNFARNLFKLEQTPQHCPLHQMQCPTSQEIAQLLAIAIKQSKQLHDPRSQSYSVGYLGNLYESHQQMLDAKHLTEQALVLAQSINANDITYRWHWQLGRILQQQQHHSQAILAYTEAVSILNSLRKELAADPETQLSFQEQVEPVYRQLVDLLLQGQVSQPELMQAREVIETLQLAEVENFLKLACLNVQPQQIDTIDPQAAVLYSIILPNRLVVIVSIAGQPLRYYQTQLPQAEIEQTLAQLRQSFSLAFPNQQRLHLAQQVYQWLIEPAKADLANYGIQQLVFVLDGMLRNLPMAALYDGQHYLIEQYRIALTPGLQLLPSRTFNTNRLKVLTGGLTEARQGFTPLPAVAVEIEQIASQVPTKVMLNEKFTQQNLQQQLEQTSFPIVHLATHGQFSSNTEETFILTWNNKISIQELEKLLEIRQPGRFDPIELLVLSACQTAMSDQRAALGLAGLAVRAGARSTLATLWSVNDQSTATLMMEFYQAFKDSGSTKSAALQHAQLLLLKEPQYKHPYFWAPFVLVGNWL